MDLKKEMIYMLTLLGILFFSVSSFARSQYVVTTKPYIIKSQSGRVLLDVPVGHQLLARSCNQETCQIRYSTDGRSFTFRLNRLDLTKANIQGPARGSTTYSESYSSELGRSGSSAAADYNERYGQIGSSEFLSCYRRRGRARYQGRRSGNLCYRGVKHILQDCNATEGYMTTARMHNGRMNDYAIWAHTEGGMRREGFRKLDTMDPAQAPNGSVIVYSNACSASHPAGHIEIKISNSEYVSDYISSRPRSVATSCRRVAGIYFK